ncbi:MAG: conjugal transfer protein TraR [SAR324 cluster bacterium]|uniref:Conjugal transfer protein TraR n=1 Tax=SAR324 cluster bacterium TaxID=2024889 RepID=A0A2A4SRA5_9DELT|nr:MAG: conjugal transfer protein TraR [SAR324 cluster bacterium]
MKEIKEKLLEMQKAIIAEIQQDRSKSASAVTNDIGDNIDHATEERDRELYQLLGERDQQKLEQIKHAIERIDDDEYGLCEDCGVQIGKKRLMALPFTQLCIECKSEEERTKGREGTLDLSNPNVESMDTEGY